MKKLLVTTLVSVLSLSAVARADENLKKDFNALGGNAEIIRRAREMDPNNRVQIVQNRLVDRHYRLEIGVNYGLIAGGDTYVQTNPLGASLDFHITPRWSIGARYYHMQNTFTRQGERAIDQAASENNNDPTRGRLFDVDRPQDLVMGVINFYPIYGKLNLFDFGVSQFDVYTLVGFGQINLERGSSETYALGGGVGLWLTQYLSSRLEIRYQGYQDQVYDESRQINWTVFTASLGFIL